MSEHEIHSDEAYEAGCLGEAEEIARADYERAVEDEAYAEILPDYFADLDASNI